MKKNKILGALSLLILASNPVFAADNNTNFESTAQIENVCLIEADDVNFGQVYAPLTQQGSKSEMRVLCSKGTSYTVDLNYGGNFVDPNGNSSSTSLTISRVHINEFASDNGFTQYKIGDGTNKVDFECWSQRVVFWTQKGADFYGATNVPIGFGEANLVEDKWNVCDTTTNSANYDTYNRLAGSNKNDKGAMIGAMKGDSLAYQITIPGDITKPWISNVNAYQATASGEFDKIEVNARIIPDSSSSLYLAQDSYFDTVTAIISY